MKYKKGDITFFTKTYSEKHKSCHICKIIKEYPTENKYLVMCTDHYVVGHHFFQLFQNMIYYLLQNRFYQMNMIITYQILIVK